MKILKVKALHKIIIVVLLFTILHTMMAEAICQEHFYSAPAFPGALGGGKYTTGGRGGKVMKVLNLNDSGKGSFREALKASGARTIVFEISGTIELETPIVIKSGDLTIAGQTAPGDGICIKGNTVRLDADNIIIRFMRFRPGDVSQGECDALTGYGQKNIIIDHCSMSWSTDETVSFYDNKNFTLQWSIISESLNNSFHRKGSHGYGGIWGGNNASFLFNLLAHHKSRNPRLQGTRYNPADGMEKTEVMNNIIYNWEDKAIYGGESGQYNIISNIFIPGPATKGSKADEILEPYEPYGKFFLKGNAFFNGTDYIAAGWDHVTVSGDSLSAIRSEEAFMLGNNSNAEDIINSYVLILEHAGASLSRDEVDKRVVGEVSTRTSTYGNSGIIDSQDVTKGWPLLISSIASPDTDGDGIPDDWEIAKGLNPNSCADGNSKTIDSQYTNLEVYLNDIVKIYYPVK